MMCFPCQACGTPCTAASVHSWVLDSPACSAACAARLPVATAPPAREALDRAMELLAQGVHTIDHALRSGRALRGQADTALVVSGVARFAAGALLGGVAGAALDAGVERAHGRHQDVLWELDQLVIVIARQLMVLHALGYAIAIPMRPLVVDHVDLVSAGVGTGARLLQLRELLIHLHGGIGVWRGALPA